jgi:hypothetical protein
MFDHADLHRHDLQLLADFLVNGVLAATAGTGQLMFGQFVNDLDTRSRGLRLPWAWKSCPGLYRIRRRIEASKLDAGVEERSLGRTHAVPP